MIIDKVRIQQRNSSDSCINCSATQLIYYVIKPSNLKVKSFQTLTQIKWNFVTKHLRDFKKCAAHTEISAN